MPRSVRQPTHEFRLRAATATDIDGLLDLENRVFTYDQISRRGFRHFVAAPTASLIVAILQDAVAGYALVLFRQRNTTARLYSIAVAAASAGRGVGPALLAASEDAARRRGARLMRLEVQEHNTAAISRYRKAGYVLFGQRAAYYDDGATAQRYEKHLSPSFTGDENCSSTPGPPAS